MSKLLAAIVFELVVGAFGLLLAWYIGLWQPIGVSTLGAPYDSHSLSKFGLDFAWGVVAAFPLFSFFVITNFLPAETMREIKRILHEELRPLLEGESYFWILLTAIAAGIGEEFFFRWALQAGFEKGFHAEWGIYAALIIASIVFGAMHWVTTTYAILAMVSGLYLGLVMIWTDSIVAPIVAHALYDFVAFVLLVRDTSTATKSG